MKVVKIIQLWIRTAVPNLSGTRTGLWKTAFRLGARRMVCDDSSEWNVCRYLHYCYSSTSGGQALDPMRLGHLLYREVGSLQRSRDEKRLETRSKHVEESTGVLLAVNTDERLCFAVSEAAESLRGPRRRGSSGNGLTCRRTPTSLGF